MSSGGFASVIGPLITSYVALKQALGRRFETQRYVLSRLDRFLTARGAADLDAETFSAWRSSQSHLKASTQRQRLGVVYQFCLFRRRSDPTSFTPDPFLFPRPHARPRPYILSEDEVAQLLRTAPELEPNALSPLRPQVARISVVLLYTTGLRRGELARLTLGDYDDVERVLLVRQTKFNKSRLLPLSPDATRELEAYLKDRQQSPFPTDPSGALLLTRHGGLTGYSGGGLGSLLRKLFRAAGVRKPDGRTPRVHDLRFTFAVHAMLRWYRAGIDVQARLPALAIYMGHGSIVSTEYYLTFVDAIAESASQRFANHCSSFLTAPVSEGTR